MASLSRAARQIIFMFTCLSELNIHQWQSEPRAENGTLDPTVLLSALATLGIHNRFSKLPPDQTEHAQNEPPHPHPPDPT